jgi:hypothetical protein
MGVHYAPQHGREQRRVAGTAAEIEDAFTRIQFSQLDDVLGGRLEVGREALVAPDAQSGIWNGWGATATCGL